MLPVKEKGRFGGGRFFVRTVLHRLWRIIVVIVKQDILVVSYWAGGWAVLLPTRVGDTP